MRILFLIGIATLCLGISQIYVSVTEPQASEASIENVDTLRGSRNVRITGGRLHLYRSFASYEPALRGMASKSVDAVYLPYVAEGSSGDEPVKVVLMTKDPRITTAFQEFAAAAGKKPLGDALSSYQKLFNETGSPRSIEGLVAGRWDLESDYDDIKKEIPDLADDFLLVKDKEKPSFLRGFGYLATAGTVFILRLWLGHPRKPTGPPPIPPQFKTGPPPIPPHLRKPRQ